MKTIVIAIIVIVVITIGIWVSVRRPGYRGAIGFKNRSASDISIIQLTGFSKPVECRSLARSEHSFNYLGRQDIPPEVRISWRFNAETADRTATVSLTDVPREMRDGEIFFVISTNSTWNVEHAPELQLEKLQRGE